MTHPRLGTTTLLTATLAVALPTVGFAAVFDSGVSDSSLFTTVINLPPAPDIGDDESIGGFGTGTTQLNIADGGSVGNSFDAINGSEVNISGGNVGDNFNALNGSEINISGGNVGNSFVANVASEVNISGGNVGDGFFALGGSEVNLFGTEFSLDDVLLDDLTLGETRTITDRDVTLSGLLADGSAFSFNLNTGFILGEDFFFTGSTLTVTLAPLAPPVPEPGSLALLAAGSALVAVRRRRG